MIRFMGANVVENTVVNAAGNVLVIVYAWASGQDWVPAGPTSLTLAKSTVSMPIPQLLLMPLGSRAVTKVVDTPMH